MPVNRGARAMLEILARRRDKPVWEATVAETRAAAWHWQEQMAEPEPVARVDHYFIPGPTAELPVRVYTPDGPGPFPGLVWLHGGGFVVGNIGLSDSPMRGTTNATGCVVIAVNYQKAPEHPFPAGLEDCMATFEWAQRHAPGLNVRPGQIGVGGDSAGGTLAAAVCLATRDRGKRQPAFQILLYPPTDSRMQTPSATENAEGYGLTTADMRWYWKQYVPDGANHDNPLVSPLRAHDLGDLPPAIIVTAEFDPLRDEAEQYADRLSQAGVPVIRHRYDGTIHGFLWMGSVVEEYERLLADLQTALKQILGTAPGQPRPDSLPAAPASARPAMRSA